ncbi:MAG: hypothetical protein J2P25_05340 [Nocardiopsaceae bacterium]|nr:hypothetical protein [Nocardiopsaceae bacterium]
MTGSGAQVPGTEARLARIRGRAMPKSHNARTIAALASNPGCARRAIMDAAGVDKQRLAAHLGYPAPFGQSRFALARGNAFEAQLKADGAAQILHLLRENLGLPLEQAHYIDLDDVGGNPGMDLRHARTRQLLARPEGTMFDHPVLRLQVGGRHAYLEPDLIAVQVGEAFRIVEIKSFPVIDGQADGGKVAAAAIQSAVYVHALRDLVGDDKVHHETILICPKDFSNQPTAQRLDVRKPLTVLRRQLSRLTRIEDLLKLLPEDLTFDLDPDPDDKTATHRRDPETLKDAVSQIDARYAPGCLSTCELCYFCRAKSSGQTARLGQQALEDLGGLDSIPAVLGLASGALRPSPERAEATAVLRQVVALRAEVFGREPEPTPAYPEVMGEAV